MRQLYNCHNLPDAAGWEVVRWVNRIDKLPDGRANVNLIYRAKNRFGGKSLYLRGLSVVGGKVDYVGEPIEQE